MFPVLRIMFEIPVIYLQGLQIIEVAVFASKAFPKASSSQIEWRILWLISNIQRHSCNNLFWEPFKLHPPGLFSCESHGGISKLYQANKSRFWKVTAYGSYGRFIPATDGNQKSGINSPVEGGRLVVELLWFTKFHISKRWFFGISEPSTVSTLLLQRTTMNSGPFRRSLEPLKTPPTYKYPSREPTIHHPWDGAVEVTCLMTSYSTCWCCHVPCWWIKSYPPIN